jgi:hypothetical protein
MTMSSCRMACRVEAVAQRIHHSTSDAGELVVRHDLHYAAHTSLGSESR